MSIRCWKVVKKDNDKFWSSHAENDLRVEYEIGKWAKSPIGGLLVFRQKRFADTFNKNGKFLVFECEALEEVKLPYARSCSWDLLLALSIWRKPPRRSMGGWPSGSKAFRLVKLLAPKSESK